MCVCVYNRCGMQFALCECVYLWFHRLIHLKYCAVFTYTDNNNNKSNRNVCVCLVRLSHHNSLLCANFGVNIKGILLW